MKEETTNDAVSSFFEFYKCLKLSVDAYCSNAFGQAD
jgi:hypothetical protein